MATDWTARTNALDYFVRAARSLKAFGDEGVHYEQAINALRRSQDHTAIQTKLNQSVARIAELEAALWLLDDYMDDAPTVRAIIRKALKL